MRAQQVVDHWREAQEAETAFVIETGDELQEKAASLRYTIAHLSGVIATKQPDYDFFIRPRLSLLLLSNAYEDAYRSFLGGTEHAQVVRSQASTLAGDILLPMSGVASMATPVEGTLAGRSVGACSDAEGYYHDCLSQINTGRYRWQQKVSVYHDRQGRPLALRKGSASSSAITLVPLSLSGIAVPPGTIGAIGPDMHNLPTGTAQQRQHSAIYGTYMIDEGGLGMHPERLSPWAYDDPLDRAVFALDYTGEDEKLASYIREHGRIVEGRTLDDFQEAAHKVMAMCGVRQ
jgi:hypothetical protein